MTGLINLLFVALGIAVGFALGWMRARQGNASLPAKLEAAQQALEQTARERTQYSERAIAAEADKRALEQRLKEQQEQLRIEFTNTANKILESVTAKFSTQSEKQIGDLLNPLRERLGDFQKLVTDSFTTQGKEQHTLKSEIEKIVLQTDSLTKALRGDVKAQGNWGEIMLERILEESGLRRDVDYIVQASDLGLTAADGSRQRPDVIVHLPDNKHIIIDSKVSLTAYDRLCDENEDTQRELQGREFIKSVKAHVNGLEQRRYQDNEKMSTPDFVLMFMPIEGAYSLALQQDRELHSYAWGKRIVIVSPTTLFATLQTVASLWKIERQNKNAQVIAAEAGKMYDKFVDFIKDMNAIGMRLNQMQASYDEALNKLAKGRGNLVSRAEKLKELDVKSTKQLPIKSDDAEEEAPRLAVAEG